MLAIGLKLGHFSIFDLKIQNCSKECLTKGKILQLFKASKQSFCFCYCLDKQRHACIINVGLYGNLAIKMPSSSPLLQMGGVQSPTTQIGVLSYHFLPDIPSLCVDLHLQVITTNGNELDFLNSSLKACCLQKFNSGVQ